MSRLQLQSKLALWPQMSSAHLLDALISDTHLGGAFPPPFCLAISLFSDRLPPSFYLQYSQEFSVARFSQVMLWRLFVCLFEWLEEGGGHPPYP